MYSSRGDDLTDIVREIVEEETERYEKIEEARKPQPTYQPPKPNVLPKREYTKAEVKKTDWGEDLYTDPVYPKKPVPKVPDTKPTPPKKRKWGRF